MENGGSRRGGHKGRTNPRIAVQAPHKVAGDRGLIQITCEYHHENLHQDEGEGRQKTN